MIKGGRGSRELCVSNWTRVDLACLGCALRLPCLHLGGLEQDRGRPRLAWGPSVLLVWGEGMGSRVAREWARLVRCFGRSDNCVGWARSKMARWNGSLTDLVRSTMNSARGGRDWREKKEEEREKKSFEFVRVFKTRFYTSRSSRMKFLFLRILTRVFNI